MKFNFLKKLVALRTIFDSEDKISFIKISFLLVISVFLEIIERLPNSTTLIE